MARIRCKNCGKIYRYETEGCCPECGAYNRPPRREQVKADGTIYHMKNNDYMEAPEEQAKTHGGKVCFEEKECYEEKVCFEDKIHNEVGPFTIEYDPKQYERDEQQQPVLSDTKKKNKSAAGLIVIILIIISVVGGMLDSCDFDDGDSDYESDYGEEYADYDDGAYIEDISDDGREVIVYVEDLDELDYATLYYYNEDGEFQSAEMETYEIEDDECTIQFKVENDFYEATSIILNYNDGEWTDLYFNE